jgi:hypothetical protein
MYSKHIGKTKVKGGMLFHYVDPTKKAGPNGEFLVQTVYLTKDVYKAHKVGAKLAKRVKEEQHLV